MASNSAGNVANVTDSRDDRAGMLVLLTGLPCTGKSSVAAEVARVLQACTISADPIDEALSAVGVANEEGKAGFEVMKALARNELGSGSSVVVDAVNPFHFVRQAYLDMAAKVGAPALVIVTVCSDRALHRRRVTERHVRGVKEIEWRGVERQMEYYEPFAGPALVVDAADPFEKVKAAAVGYVLGGPPGHSPGGAGAM